jgi:hypothetical protein
MTRDGKRCREKNGISIPSQVPYDGETERLLGELAVNRQELKRLSLSIPNISREISEEFP